MSKLWSVIRWGLIIWGMLSFIGALFVVGIAAYQLGPGNRASIKIASTREVRYVLNWSRLGDERIEEVLHSYISSRSFGGDHLDAHAIRISHVDEAELVPDGWGAGWYRGSEVTGVLEDALEFVEGWLHDENISWFPRASDLRSDDILVFPWRIDLHGTKPTAVKLIFVRPKDRMVFFISGAV